MKPSPHSLNHSLSSLPLPHSLNYISRLCLSPSSPSQLSPNHSLAQVAAHSLNHSLPLSHSHLCLSPSSPSQHTLYLVAITLTPSSLPRLQGTLSILILLSFISIYIFFDQFLKEIKFFFSNKNK